MTIEEIICSTADVIELRGKDLDLILPLAERWPVEALNLTAAVRVAGLAVGIRSDLTSLVGDLGEVYNRVWFIGRAGLHATGHWRRFPAFRESKQTLRSCAVCGQTVMADADVVSARCSDPADCAVFIRAVADAWAD